MKAGAAVNSEGTIIEVPCSGKDCVSFFDPRYAFPGAVIIDNGKYTGRVKKDRLLLQDSVGSLVAGRTPSSMNKVTSVFWNLLFS